ncbi:hypothetical protein EsDP_00003297 [Epichloe bromicola]|uniref:DUF7730 domain-containing protein n=1 Tax=Epichloe bromicola TaxID=79588 RepID=A0ABQ0CNB8_9HYPO
MCLEGHIDPQLQSVLAQLPAEVRRQIYAHIVPAQAHLYQDQGNIHVATCITPRPSNDHYCFDRRSLGDPSTEVWARRLQSPWGGHWRCEEVAKRLHHPDVPGIQTRHDAARALMSACRRTFEDVACLLAETSVIHVDDLSTLDVLLDGRDSSLFSIRPGHLLTKAFFNTRRLNLSFRLPPAVFKAVEASSTPARDAPSYPGTSSPTSWFCLWQCIAALRHLRTVDITLDHDSESSWSSVNEHAVLSPLQALASNPDLRTTIHLPRVASSHFNTTSLGFAVKRFTRQRFFTEYRNDGSIGVVYEEDAYKSLHRPGQGSADAVRAAELTMHIWFQGIDLDYDALDESPGLDQDSGCDA